MFANIFDLDMYPPMGQIPQNQSQTPENLDPSTVI
jgi:hypothetical protein